MLHMAAQNADRQIVNLLHEKGVPLDQIDEQNQAPVHKAIAANQTGSLESLLEWYVSKSLKYSSRNQVKLETSELWSPSNTIFSKLSYEWTFYY